MAASVHIFSFYKMTKIDAITQDKQSPIVAKHAQNQYKTTYDMIKSQPFE